MAHEEPKLNVDRLIERLRVFADEVKQFDPQDDVPYTWGMIMVEAAHVIEYYRDRPVVDEAGVAQGVDRFLNSIHLLRELGRVLPPGNVEIQNHLNEIEQELTTKLGKVVVKTHLAGRPGVDGSLLGVWASGSLISGEQDA